MKKGKYYKYKKVTVADLKEKLKGYQLVINYWKERAEQDEGFYIKEGTYKITIKRIKEEDKEGYYLILKNGSKIKVSPVKKEDRLRGCRLGD